MSKQSEIFISSSERVVEDKNGLGISDGESFRAYVVLGGIPMWSAVMYGDKKQQESVRERMQADVKTKVEING